MYNTIGLAMRARKVTIGTEITINGVRNSKVKLVLLASNASKNTQKLVNDKCKTYNVDVIIVDGDLMSNAIGKNNVKVLGIIDDGFRQLVLNQKRKWYKWPKKI